MNFQTLLLLFVLYLNNLSSVSSDSARPTDRFTGECLPVGDGVERKLWSNPSTWPGNRVPGIRTSMGMNVSIPCGQAVVLDVPEVTIGTLVVKGLLTLRDSPKMSKVKLRANFIIVEGTFSIGTKEKHYSQKAEIELTPNSANKRSSFLFTDLKPADPAHPRDFGHKAFIVVGGKVEFFGVPGGSKTVVWCRLVKTAEKDADKIYVDAEISWPVGAQIAVSSTDYQRNQTEVFQITEVRSVNSKSTEITLDKPLQYMHYGEPNSLSDGFGGFVDERAEVALLDRNIVVMGTKEDEPYNLEGGHFMVFMTNSSTQTIEGVQFRNMGQQGKLGRYPIHFHVLGSVPKTVCRKNAIVYSNQRCVVIHASHNITVEENVAFDTRGHCFMTEEGGERDNKFLRNLGMLTQAVKNKIMLPNTNPPISEETDDKPSTFWMASGLNSLRGNVAAGSQDSGFWFELRFAVRGLSLSISDLNSTIPFLNGISDFRDNVAHSNGVAGLRTYPPGIRPRINGWNEDGPIGTIESFLSYKNVYQGMFVHHTDLLHIKNCTFADNGWGLHLNQDFRVTVSGSRFVALTDNLGNPSGCSSSSLWTNCRSAQPGDCKMPLPVNSNGRSTGGVNRVAPTFGVVIDQSRLQDRHFAVRPNALEYLKFHNYDSSCSTATAIALLGKPENGDYWNPSHSVKGLKFSSNTQPVWAAPQFAQIDQWNNIFDTGEAAQFYTLLDMDGSTMGSKGYIVANVSSTLPPGMKGCTAKPKWNAYGCQGVCYRTILVAYPEPGFDRSPSNVNNDRKDFSFLKIRRKSDGTTISLDGNLKKYKFPDPIQRYYLATLLANDTYEVEIVPPSKSPSFLPERITLGLMDSGLCGRGLTVRLKHVPNKPWQGQGTGSAFLKQCPGASSVSDSSPKAEFSTVCIDRKPWLEVVFNSKFSSSINFTTGSTNDGGLCPQTRSCSMVWSGSSGWLFDDSGLERRPQFYNPVLISPSNWKQGRTPFGRNPWNPLMFNSGLAKPEKSRITYYFRKTFSLSKSSCYSALNVDLTVQDGAVLYLNNKEALRVNMPSGSITNKTFAASRISNPLIWKTFSLPLSSDLKNYFLVEGTNTLALELHVENPWVPVLSFDIRVSGFQSSLDCKPSNGTAEICDGIDNNLNGKVDEGPDGKPLTQPCRTACGVGVATCISGIYQKCTAKVPTEEVCDGLDNNCDGLVDNGFKQLNCQSGSACFSGRCLPTFNATKERQIWPKKSSGWYYYDNGGNLNLVNAKWWQGVNVSSWPKGSAPLGYNYNSQKNPWDNYSTTLKFFAKDDRSLTAYFVKTFSMSPADIKNTFRIGLNLRRVDGAIVYLNGGELWRSNMPWGKVYWNSTSQKSTLTKEWSPGCCDVEWTYKECPVCHHNTTSLLRVGVNTIAAEVHLAYRYKKSLAFDMDLIQNYILPCSSFPGSPKTCIRKVQQVVSPISAQWKYLDGTLPLPSSNWILPAFNDKSWKSGVAPLGYGSGADWLIATQIESGDEYEPEPRRAFYFRKSIEVPDAACYVELQSNLRSKDGAVVYINGKEVYRRNLPSGPINATVFARYPGEWSYQTQILTGGWLKKGVMKFYK